MIMKDFVDFISNFMTIEELFLAGIGAIFIIVIFILGGKEQKEMESKNRKVDELRSCVYPR